LYLVITDVLRIERVVFSLIKNIILNPNVRGVNIKRERRTVSPIEVRLIA